MHIKYTKDTYSTSLLTLSQTLQNSTLWCKCIMSQSMLQMQPESFWRWGSGRFFSGRVTWSQPNRRLSSYRIVKLKAEMHKQAAALDFIQILKTILIFKILVIKMSVRAESLPFSRIIMSITLVHFLKCQTPHCNLTSQSLALGC